MRPRAGWMLCLVILTVACGDRGAAVDPKGATLPEPWKVMNLPVGAGDVDITEDGGVHVAYKGGVGGSPEDQRGRWHAALTAAGWSQAGEPRRAGPILVTEYQRDAKTVTLMVTPMKNRVDVQAEIE